MNTFSGVARATTKAVITGRMSQLSSRKAVEGEIWNAAPALGYTKNADIPPRSRVAASMFGMNDDSSIWKSGVPAQDDSADGLDMKRTYHSSGVSRNMTDAAARTSCLIRIRRSARQT